MIAAGREVMRWKLRASIIRPSGEQEQRARAGRSSILSRRRRGQVPLRVVVVLFFVALAAVAWWTYSSTHSDVIDGRETIVFWGNPSLTDEIYTVVHRFEKDFPQYKVVVSTPAAQDVTGDAQRLLCAISGGVPPDVVYFDRFAIGEWAA